MILQLAAQKWDWINYHGDLLCAADTDLFSHCLFVFMIFCLCVTAISLGCIQILHTDCNSELDHHYRRSVWTIILKLRDFRNAVSY